MVFFSIKIYKSYYTAQLLYICIFKYKYQGSTSELLELCSSSEWTAEDFAKFTQLVNDKRVNVNGKDATDISQSRAQEIDRHGETFGK